MGERRDECDTNCNLELEVHVGEGGLQSGIFEGVIWCVGGSPSPRANQGINLYASLVLMVRSRRGGKVAGNCEAVGGGFVHARPSPKILEPQDVVHRRFREGHEDIQCSQRVSTSLDMQDTPSLKRPTTFKSKSMVNS